MKLTLPQQDIYFEQLLHPEDPIYNIGAKLKVDGEIVYEILNEAYITLIDQHDAYRSVVVKNGDKVEIVMKSTHNSTLGFIDFSNEENADEKANAYMQQAFVTPFNILSGELLHNFTLIKVDEEFYYIFSMYHHIITDGWGTSLMFQRWVKNYNELVESGKIETEYPFSYEEFAINDKDYEQSEDYLQDKDYWSQRYAELPEPLFEKFDKQRSINKSSREELVISRKVYSQLEAMAKEYRSSTFHVILGILFMYFGRKHQNNDFAIGLPVLNRGKSVFKKTVGLFMGVSALRTPLDFNNSFEELIGQIKQQLRQDYRHQRFPIGKLIKELGLFQNKDGLFNITLSYEKQNYSDHFHNTKTRVIPLSHEAERVALAIYIREFDAEEDVKIDFDYNLNYFNKESISQVVTHFEQLVEEVVVDAKKPLASYKYITLEERRKVVQQFNDTSFFYPKKMTFLDFFKNRINANPDKIAVKDTLNAYSYSELGMASDKVAYYLQENFGTKSSSPIAVLMDRSANMIAVLLGILKTGRAYIPLDPSFPADRLNYIISHSEVDCVLGDGQLQELLNDDIIYSNIDVLLDCEIHNEIELDEVNADATAYVIYTSGSTGNPKGVEVGHGSLLNFLLSMQLEPGIRTADVLFSVTTASFDISILEFFAPLLCGSTLVVANKENLATAKSIINDLTLVKPTIIQATPSFFQMLFNGGWTGDKDLRVLCGGDLLSESLAQKLLENCKSVWNMYGPTETTIWSSCKRLRLPNDAKTIGMPIHNTQFYILDEALNPLPTGSIGAVYIGGDGLSKGYYKNEELTRQHFLPSPFRDGERIYRTGDLGRWNLEGEIEFLGRSDQQVKVRGYRIETGEIESRLNDLAEINDSVVIAKKSADQGAFLVAFVIANSDNLDTQKVVSELQKNLPNYMIPYTVIEVESFPLTPNNKVDRKSLSKFDIGASHEDSTFVKPSTGIETVVAKIYEEVLDLKNAVSVNSNFFSLGGHSLNAVKLIGLVEKKLNYQITLRTVFDYPTVESLSSYLQLEETESLDFISKVPEQKSYPITSSQYAMWLASQKKERSISYNMFTSYEIKGELDIATLEEAFKNIIDKYEILRTNFIEEKGTPFQTINLLGHRNFQIIETTADSNELDTSIELFVNREFDLEKDQLLRASIFINESGDRFLVFATHHIIMDGWSLEVLISELAEQYSSLISSKVLDDQDLTIQFKDYAAWNAKNEEQALIKNSAFWNAHLEGYKWSSLVPVDYQNTTDAARGRSYVTGINRDTTSELQKLVSRQNSSLHSILIAAFNGLLYKMKGKTDVCLGTVNSGRNFANATQQIGMFVKTLPLRTMMSSSDSFLDVLSRVHDNLLDTDLHQDIPEDIARDLRLDVLIVLQNQSFNFNKIKISDRLELQLRPIETLHSRLPLLIEFTVDEGYLKTNVNYDSDTYNSETIELLMLKYEKFLEEIVQQPYLAIDEIDIDLEFEREEQVDISFNF